MILPESNLRTIRRLDAGALKSVVGSRSRLAGLLVLLAILAAVGWMLWVYAEIRYYADRNEARPADAIAVFGAAEYDGRPSPVLRARLEHALTLYQEKIAPLVITL